MKQQSKWLSKDAIRWYYRILLITVATCVAIQAISTPPSTGDPEMKWTHALWQPSYLFSAFLAIVVLSLALATRWPAWSVAAYVILEHSLYRYGPELRYLYINHLPEWGAILGSLGVFIWWIRHPAERPKPNRIILVLMGLLVSWAMVSALAATIRTGQWQFEPRHHPARYIDALALCFSAAFGVRGRRDYYVVVAALTGAILWQTLYWKDNLYLNGDLAFVIAMSVPLLILSAFAAPGFGLRSVAAIAALSFVRLIVRIQSRGGAVGLVFSMAALWFMSFRRWLILCLAIPFVVGTVYLVKSDGFWQRIRGSVPGGSSYGSVQGRLVLWHAAWEMTHDHWLLGVGPGNYSFHSAEYDGSKARSTHNNFLAIVAELGYPGLILYATVFATTVAFLWRCGRAGPRAWPSPEARGVAGAIFAYLGAGCFISRNDQALAYILVGVAAALTTREMGNRAREETD